MKSEKQGELVRSLGLFSVFMLTVSSIIGSGIYKKVAPMAAALGSADLVLWCLVAAGLISLFGALSNAEIAGMLADSGGEYNYYSKIYNKFFAFLFGWTNFTAIRSASAASVAYVFAESLNSMISLPTLPETWAQISLWGIFTPFDNFGVKLVAIVLIGGLSYVNYIGLKVGEGLSRWILIIVVLSIFLIIILGLTIGGGSYTNFQTPASNYVQHSITDADFLSGVFAALLAAFWAYEGWSAIGYLGGEIKNPNRVLPLAFGLGVLFVIVVYVGINFTYLFVLPIDEVIKADQSQNVIVAVEVVRRFLGGPGVIFISILILFTTFGCTNTTLLTPPRLFYAMAKEGMFFKSSAYIHPKYNTPSNAISLQGWWAAILIFSGSFDQLTDMLVFASFIFYGATALGVFILRVKMPDVHRPYKAWGYPIVPAFFVLFCLALVIVTLVTKPREALMGLGLMLVGIPFYLYWNRTSKQ